MDISMDALVMAQDGPMRDFLCGCLEERCQWECAWDDALANARERNPFLLFLDWRHPEAAALSQWRASRQEVRCLVVIEEGRRDLLDDALAAGADAWIWWSSTHERPAGVDADLCVERFVSQFQDFLERQYKLIRFEKIIELTSDSVEIANNDIFWEFLNPSFSEITGYSVEEALGHSPRQLLYSGIHKDEHYQRIHHALQSRKLWQGGHIGRRKDNTLSFQVLTIALVANERGDELGNIGLRRDLFQPRFARKQRALASSLAESDIGADSDALQSWIREATDALLLFDANEQVIDANKAACQQLGYPLHELTKLSLGAFDLEFRPGLLKSWFAGQEPGVNFTHQTWLRRKDGSTFAAQLRLCVLLVGDSHFLAAAVQDVTDLTQSQRRLEQLNQDLRDAKNEAVEASRAKSLFLANMSHELRTPLNAVIGYAQLLGEELADEGRTLYLPDLEKIEVSATHLLALINNILDISKIEANKIELTIEEVSAKEIINDVCYTMEVAAKKQGNELSCGVMPGVAMMQVDRLRLRQVLLNLLNNACKFTTQGHIELVARPAIHDGEAMVVFAVKDDGIGIAPEEQKSLFRPFSQGAARSTVIQDRGSGLGLAICEQLLHAMGGFVRFESALGQGSLFEAWLPLSPPPEVWQRASTEQPL